MKLLKLGKQKSVKQAGERERCKSVAVTYGQLRPILYYLCVNEHPAQLNVAAYLRYLTMSCTYSSRIREYTPPLERLIAFIKYPSYDYHLI